MALGWLVMYTGCIIGSFSTYHPVIMFVSMAMIAIGLFMMIRSTPAR